MARGRVVTIDGSRITDWESFHDVCAEVFGFPDWYGRNADAWIDLVTGMDRDDAMTAFSVGKGEIVTIKLDGASAMRAGARDQYDALVECAAFVNWRRVERGESAYLCLAFRE
jgi:hypothetical protein